MLMWFEKNRGKIAAATVTIVSIALLYFYMLTFPGVYLVPASNVTLLKPLPGHGQYCLIVWLWKYYCIGYANVSNSTVHVHVVGMYHHYLYGVRAQVNHTLLYRCRCVGKVYPYRKYGSYLLYSCFHPASNVTVSYTTYIPPDLATALAYWPK